jgi:predicted Zn-dependent protease
MSVKRFLAYAALTVLLTACATNPVTGRRQFMLVSEDSAIAASAQAYTEMLAPLEKEGKIDSNPALKKRVETITGRLIPQAIKYRPETKDWAWSVKIIDDPETVNAFAMAGGKMAVYTGLIEKIHPTDDELAQVLGHEIAHALSAHTAEKMSVAMASDLAVSAVALTQDQPGIAMSGAALAAALAIKLPNSRTMESEADRIGIELAAKAGYNPYAAVSLWKKMAKEGESSSFEFLSTHPAPSRRIETLAALAPQMMPYYQAKGARPVYQFPAR